jgi:hypothetical protein
MGRDDTEELATRNTLMAIARRGSGMVRALRNAHFIRSGQRLCDTYR